MRVTTHNDTDWCVRANWLGADRVVFVGTIFACLDFIR